MDALKRFAARFGLNNGTANEEQSAPLAPGSQPRSRHREIETKQSQVTSWQHRGPSRLEQPSVESLRRLGFQSIEAGAIREKWHDRSAEIGRDVVPGSGVFFVDSKQGVMSGLPFRAYDDQTGISVVTMDDKGTPAEIQLAASDLVFFRPTTKIRLGKTEMASLKENDTLMLSRFDDGGRQVGFARASCGKLQPKLELFRLNRWTDIYAGYHCESFGRTPRGELVGQESGTCHPLVDLLAPEGYATRAELTKRILSLGEPEGGESKSGPGTGPNTGDLSQLRSMPRPDEPTLRKRTVRTGTAPSRDPD